MMTTAITLTTHTNDNDDYDTSGARGTFAASGTFSYKPKDFGLSKKFSLSKSTTSLKVAKCQ